MVQRLSESEPAMPDPATRSRVCAQRSSSAAVDLVSGLARFQSQLAITAPARMPIITVDSSLSRSRVLQLAEARQQKNGVVGKIKAEVRVGSLGGMRKEPTRAQKGIVETDKTRTNLPTPF